VGLRIIPNITERTVAREVEFAHGLRIEEASAGEPNKRVEEHPVGTEPFHQVTDSGVAAFRVEVVSDAPHVVEGGIGGP
jgi:hypothetical protein